MNAIFASIILLTASGCSLITPLELKITEDIIEDVVRDTTGVDLEEDMKDFIIPPQKAPVGCTGPDTQLVITKGANGPVEADYAK